MTAPLRIGLLGGTFDPVHNAHLALAREALDAGLDQIWFLPCAQQALKAHAPHASAADRLAMLRLALADDPRYVLRTDEIDRGGTTYTVDTLAALTAAYPAHRFTCIIGMDSAQSFLSWKDPDRLLTLCSFMVFDRPGCPPPTHRLAHALLQHRLSGTPSTLSSSQVRKMIAENAPIGYLVPRAVENHIRRKGLYRHHDHDSRTDRP